MTAKEIEFIRAVSAVADYLADRWFPDYEKAPCGLSYSCDMCDQHCGRGDHEPECLYLMGRELRFEFDNIDVDPKYEKTLFGQPRGVEDIEQARNFTKWRYIMRTFVPNILIQLPPVDYADLKNVGYVCSCSILMMGTDKRYQHHAQCPIVALAKALKNLL